MHNEDRTRRRLLAGAENRDEEASLIPEFPTNASLLVYSKPSDPPLPHPPILTSIYRDIQKVNRLDARCLGAMLAKSCTSFQQSLFTSCMNPVTLMCPLDDITA